MHFKRNLWLSFTGATIIIFAVLFGSQQTDADLGMQRSLPQISQYKSQQESNINEESNAQSSYFNY